MKAPQFKALLDSLASLTPSQRKKLAASLSPAVVPAAPSQALDRLQPGACPHCSSELVVRNGMADGLQRYHGHTNKTFHVQTTNNCHEQLKTWTQRGLRGLRGVATKYLPNYLAWHRLMTWNKAGLTSFDVLRSALGQQVINT